jgi:sterol desaturase/sphingolipid hydroxylase (fatty acid hydroxylase superfamily)
MLEQALSFIFSDWLSLFFNPQKRIFWGYLLSALLLAVAWLVVYKECRLYDSLRQIFSPANWLSKSVQTDYLLMIINGMVMTLLSPRLLGKAAVATFIFTALHQLLEGRILIATHLPDWFIATAFTLFLFIFDDFARYWLHRWLHKVSFLWAFHKVHHSATILNPFTVFRSHPVEAILFSLRSALVQGISVAIFIYFFGDKVTLVMVLGASVFSFIFNLIGSNLRHSSIPMGYWKPIEHVFMSPAQHQVHHSYAPEHIDKNFGVALSLWDTCFGSLCCSTKNQQLSYGLTESTNDNQHTLVMLYIHPFKEVWLKFSKRRKI